MQIFNSPATIKQRALEMLLTFAIVSVGFVCTTQLDSIPLSVAGGMLTGILMMYFADRFWPMQGDAPDRHQWILFLAVLVIPCAIASIGVLTYALYQHSSSDSYFGALLVAAVLYAPLQLYRVSKRVSE